MDDRPAQTQALKLAAAQAMHAGAVQAGSISVSATVTVEFAITP
jgi:hypothetical protein